MDKKYEITSKHLVHLDGGQAVCKVEIFADTVDDVPEQEDSWAVGRSRVFRDLCRRTLVLL